jgi:hypothetical protein
MQALIFFYCCILASGFLLLYKQPVSTIAFDLDAKLPMLIVVFLMSVREQTQHLTLIKFVFTFLITINPFVFLVSIRYKMRQILF